MSAIGVSVKSLFLSQRASGGGDQKWFSLPRWALSGLGASVGMLHSLVGQLLEFILGEEPSGRVCVCVCMYSHFRALPFSGTITRKCP